jgi:hypothetical protein
MNAGDIRQSALQPSVAEISFVWFHRVIAVYCLMFGISYWIRLIGYYDGPNWRFDMMAYYWQIASASLAVLVPFAGIGLWMTASWGPVIWFVCAAAEAVMFLGFPGLFGSRPAVILSHFLVAALYCAFRVAIHSQKKKAER